MNLRCQQVVFRHKHMFNTYFLAHLKNENTDAKICQTNFLRNKMSYNIILDELLVAQEDLLPAEDGGLGPGLEGSGAGVSSCQHLYLGSFGNTSHHLISGLKSRRQSVQTS